MAATNKIQQSRRDFLKKSAVAGIGTSIVATALPPAEKKEGIKAPPGQKGFSLFRKEHDTIDEVYEIANDYERMDHKNIIFSRWAWDPKYYKPGGRGIAFILKDSGEVPNPTLTEPGYSILEHALHRASWGSHDLGAPFSNAGLHNQGSMNRWEDFIHPHKKEPHKFKSPGEASKIIKRASRFLGADEVGIAPYDERWTFSKVYDVTDVFLKGKSPEEASHEMLEFPFEVKSVIAFTHEMDYDAINAGGLGDSAAGLEYSHMAEVTHKVAVFLNHLGYKAIPAGNDVGLSIPIAAQAGLGEQSRMGTLISEKFGSRVRISKVYTDLELEPDKPRTFGVTEFCIKCKKCAEHCPSDAISLEDLPTLEPTIASISTNRGVKRWYHDNEKCFSQWEKTGTGCGVCLAVCPYNKLDTWVHVLSEMVVSAPVGRDIARQLDDAFGYGDLDPKKVERFWDMND